MIDIVEQLDKYLGEGPTRVPVETNLQKYIDAKDETMYMSAVLGIKRREGKMKYKGWQADEEPMVGTYRWFKSGVDYDVWSTPFFEAKGISIQAATSDIDDWYSQSYDIPFKVTWNPEKDFAAYMKITAKAIDKKWDKEKDAWSSHTKKRSL